MNDFLAAENTSEILLRIYCSIRSSPTIHTKLRLASSFRTIFLATVPSNNSAVEANAPEWNVYSQNPDSESQNVSKSGAASSSSSSNGKNADISESTARVTLHICISLLREEAMASIKHKTTTTGGGWLSEVPLFYIVIDVLTTLTNISLDPNNQNLGKEVDANFIGRHMDLIIQVFIYIVLFSNSNLMFHSCITYLSISIHMEINTLLLHLCFFLSVFAHFGFENCVMSFSSVYILHVHLVFVPYRC